MGYSWEFLEGALSFAEASLFCGKAGEKKNESVWETVVPRAFYVFDYCYFYRDTQWEPLWRREWSGGVPPCSPNPDPISHQKMSFSTPVFRSDLHIRFQTWPFGIN